MVAMNNKLVPAATGTGVQTLDNAVCRINPYQFAPFTGQYYPPFVQLGPDQFCKYFIGKRVHLHSLNFSLSQNAETDNCVLRHLLTRCNINKIIKIRSFISVIFGQETLFPNFPNPA